MSNWVKGANGRILIVPEERPRRPSRRMARRISGGIILVVVLVIVIALMVAWPGNNPAALPVSAERGVDVRLISGVAGPTDGEDHLFALTTTGDGSAQPALTVFTIADTGVPHQTSSLPAPVDRLDDDLPATPGIALSGDTAFIPLAGTDRSILWIVDVSDPNSPEELSTTELKTLPGVVAVNGDLAVVGPMDGRTIRFFDISDPEQPQPLSIYQTAERAVADLAFVEDDLYISSERGVTAMDVSSPESLSEISHWESDTWTQDVQMTTITTDPRITAAGGHLFAAANVWGVDILDASNPSDIDSTTRKLSRSQIPYGGADQAIGLAAKGDRLYVLWRRDHIGDDPHRWAYTIQEIDVSEPGDPDVVSETDDISGESTLKSLAIADDYVYFLNGDRIHSVSISESAE